MKITFVTPTPPDISAFGTRSLSAYLKKKGYATRIIFLPGGIEMLSDKGDVIYHYDEKVLEQIVEICKDSTLIGISFMTYYFDRAVEITNFIKKSIDTPVIWGGIHPTINPEEGLRYADMVCVGEGEDVLLQLMQRIESKKKYHDIKGLWLKDNSSIIKNGIAPIIKDLDILPFFDYDISDHCIYNVESKEIQPFDVDLFKKVLPLLPYFNNKLYITYRTMTDRGCPHHCTYCNVTNLKRMYRDDNGRYFRARSIGHVIEELVSIKERFPFIQAIQFFDDTFFARPFHEIEEFSRVYKDKVSLPFYCQGSPNTITEKKMEYLVEAGLVYVEMGIQTGSEKTKQLYMRKESNDKIIKTSQIIARYKNKILPPDYHIIVDNPWEMDDDLLETLKLLLKIPKPYGLCIASLTFFPGTDLYNKAKEEGLIKDEASEIYRRAFLLAPTHRYINLLIYFLSFYKFPKCIVKVLANERIIRFVSKKNLKHLYLLIYKISEMLYLLFKGMKALLAGDFIRIRRYFFYRIR